MSDRLRKLRRRFERAVQEPTTGMITAYSDNLLKQIDNDAVDMILPSKQ